MTNLSWLCALRDAPSMLVAALYYAAHGWPVFPLLGKYPPSELAADENDPNDRGGFHRATTNRLQISEWWKRWPNANIGWPIPPGHFAIDEDPRHAGDFARTMLELVHGQLPFTLRQVTGGGGYHWIFRHAEGVKIHQRSGWFDGVDTRAAGKGYLLVEPSIHPDTRRVYRWHSAVSPLIAPNWLIDVVRVREVERAPYVAASKTDKRTLSRRQKWAQVALERAAADVAGQGKGSRNDTLNAVAYRMGRLVGGGMLDESEVRATLRNAGIACGLSEHEIDKVLT